MKAWNLIPRDGSKSRSAWLAAMRTTCSISSRQPDEDQLKGLPHRQALERQAARMGATDRRGQAWSAEHTWRSRLVMELGQGPAGPGMSLLVSVACIIEF